jgi:predicted N-acyltransferase
MNRRTQNIAEGCELYETIAAIPPDVWNAARSATPSCFTDPAFLHAVERGLPERTRVFHVVVRDEKGNPAACASLCLMAVDLLLLTPLRVLRLAGWGRRPRFAMLQVLFCGLPVSSGQSQIGFAPGADRKRAIEKLDDLMQTLARQERAKAIVYKEFSDSDCQDLDGLVNRGYMRTESRPTYELTRPFADFDAYCSSLKSHYRNDVRRSQKKFDRAGCSVVHLTNPDDILHEYTPKVHRLYEAVVVKSDVKLEMLPIQFFRELVKHHVGRVSLTAIYRDDQIVAFNWGLDASPVYLFLFCGVDYAKNAEADLYFNLMYHQLDLAFRRGARLVKFGQTADAFKRRIGGAGRPLNLYVQPRGWFFAWIIHFTQRFLFRSCPVLEAHDVFKEVPANAQANRNSKGRKGAGKAHALSSPIAR